MHYRILLFLMMGLTACKTHNSANAPSESEEKKLKAHTYYYYGDVQAMSADGNQKFGDPQPVLVKRELSPVKATIVETITKTGGTQIRTMLRKTYGKPFEVSDQKKTLTGTFTPLGNPWKMGDWRFDIRLTDGKGRMQGQGTYSSAIIETAQDYSGSDGKPAARFLEKLRTITTAEYQHYMQQFQLKFNTEKK